MPASVAVASRNVDLIMYPIYDYVNWHTQIIYPSMSRRHPTNPHVAPAIVVYLLQLLDQFTNSHGYINLRSADDVARPSGTGD